MSKALPFVTFTAGAAIGSVAAWYFAKKKYELIAQEEIDSVKETFAKRVPAISGDDISNRYSLAISEDDHDIMGNASKLMNDEGHTNYSNIEMPFPEIGTEKKTMGEEKPYVISPDEFGEMDEYRAISLTYYADQILTDDMDELVEDVDNVVGFESLNHFGEYEDDSVFVRNDRLKADYEILLDERNYSDVLKTKPYLG